MTDTTFPASNNAQSARTHAIICYVLMLASFFTGLTGLIGLIWAYVAKGGATGTFAEDHFRNVIRTFWFSLMWFIIAAITIKFLIGGAVALFAGIWVLYRMIKGLVRVMNYKAFYDLPI